MSVDRVESTVATMASALAQLLTAIASADATVIGRIQQARDESQLKFQRKLREDDHLRARD